MHQFARLSADHEPIIGSWIYERSEWNKLRRDHGGDGRNQMARCWYGTNGLGWDASQFRPILFLHDQFQQISGYPTDIWGYPRCLFLQIGDGHENLSRDRPLVACAVVRCDGAGAGRRIDGAVWNGISEI